MKILMMFLLSLSAFSQDIYQFSFKDTAGKTINLKDYKGKAILIANIATRCGYTGQLDNLEKLYKEYKDKGLVVIGLPANDFGGQTPESNEEVAKFCRLKYGASFPIAEKMVVTGDDKEPLVSSLLKQAKIDEIKWNFEKFLFDKDGKFVKHYRSSTKPDASEVKEQVELAIK